LNKGGDNPQVGVSRQDVQEYFRQENIKPESFLPHIFLPAPKLRCQIITACYFRPMQNRPDLPEDDPLGLDRVEREIHIEKLRRDINAVAGGEVFSCKADECDPKVEEAFLENILALETHGFVCPFDTLVSDGFILPPAAQLDDAALTLKLWELIRALAVRRLFLHCTDHL